MAVVSGMDKSSRTTALLWITDLFSMLRLQPDSRYCVIVCSGVIYVLTLLAEAAASHSTLYKK